LAYLCTPIVPAIAAIDKHIATIDKVLFFISRSLVFYHKSNNYDIGCKRRRYEENRFG
jgi:hypothetical protein